jgi:hypothetical protein
MTEPIKLPKLPEPWNFTRPTVEAYTTLAVEQATADLRAQLETAEHALRSKGYRKSCDIPACNCGDQWTHGGHAAERLSELSSELHGSPVDMGGKTLLAGLTELIERLEKAEAVLARLTTLRPASEWENEAAEWWVQQLSGEWSPVDPVTGTHWTPLPDVKEATNG